MDQVYIIVKKRPVQCVCEGKETTVDFRTNEAVLPTEAEAKRFLDARKALKDRDDIGCSFMIEPWVVGIVGF